MNSILSSIVPGWGWFDTSVLVFTHMEPQSNQVESVIAPLKKVTPLSKYLAMVLFIIMPFVGGWIGYTYAPEKVVEVERVIIQESSNNEVEGKYVNTELVVDGECFSTNDQNLSDINLKLADEWGNLYSSLYADRYPYTLGFYCHFENDYSLASFGHEVFLFNSSNEMVKQAVVQDKKNVDPFPELIEVKNGLASLYLPSGDGGIRAMMYYVLDLETFRYEKVAAKFSEYGIGENGKGISNYKLSVGDGVLYEMKFDNEEPITKLNITNSESVTIEVVSAKDEILYSKNIQLNEVGL